MENTKIVDGKEYIVKICPKCGNELLFSKQPMKRRIHGMCRKCGKEFEVEI